MTELERAKEQIAFAHGYALRLIEQTDPAEWFRIPTAGVSNIAWQVGHLAFADYRLALLRLRGKLPSDKELIPDEFLRSYGADSVPDAVAFRPLVPSRHDGSTLDHRAGAAIDEMTQAETYRALCRCGGKLIDKGFDGEHVGISAKRAQRGRTQRHVQYSMTDHLP